MAQDIQALSCKMSVSSKNTTLLLHTEYSLPVSQQPDPDPVLSYMKRTHAFFLKKKKKKKKNLWARWQCNCNMRLLTLSYHLSVRTSVCPHSTGRLLPHRFSWHYVTNICIKICRYFSNVLQIGQKWQTRHRRTTFKKNSSLPNHVIQTGRAICAVRTEAGQKMGLQTTIQHNRL